MKPIVLILYSSIAICPHFSLSPSQTVAYRVDASLFTVSHFGNCFFNVLIIEKS